jgi:hypothetical protein
VYQGQCRYQNNPTSKHAIIFPNCETDQEITYNSSAQKRKGFKLCFYQNETEGNNKHRKLSKQATTKKTKPHRKIDQHLPITEQYQRLGLLPVTNQRGQLAIRGPARVFTAPTKTERLPSSEQRRPSLFFFNRENPNFE